MNRLLDTMSARHIVQHMIDTKMTNYEILDIKNIDDNTIDVIISNNLLVRFYSDLSVSYIMLCKVNDTFIHNSMFYLICDGFEYNNVCKYIDMFLGTYIFNNYLNNEILHIGSIQNILDYCKANEIDVMSWRDNSDNFAYSYTFNRRGVANFRINGAKASMFNTKL